MKKSQYNLCLDVLKILHKEHILSDVIIIGSWCQQFYKTYFGSTSYNPVIKTRDIDFLIPEPDKIKVNKDISELLKPLGFIVSFIGPKGYIRLEHPELIIEFLTQEKGRGVDKPVQLSMLGINLLPLRFLNVLTSSIITLHIEGIEIKIPHPANYALHKLIISQRRQGSHKWKAQKDRDTAIEILKALGSKKEILLIKKVFNSLPVKWQKDIIAALNDIPEQDRIIKILKY